MTRQDQSLSPEIVQIDRESGKITVPELSDPLAYYKITSYSNKPDAAELSLETNTVPLSIAGPYLQLPASLPPAIRELAQQVTAGLQGNYDKVSAIAQYLKTNYSYSLDAPTRPGNSDFVSHFLFVDRTGYCEHFSTAMVVMLRSIGIPARWVKGYAPGEEARVEGANYKYVTVRATDAHAWVEVYFPQSEWVSFDPTPGFSSLTPLSQEGVLAGSYNEVRQSPLKTIKNSAGDGASSLQQALSQLQSQFTSSMKAMYEWITAHPLLGSTLTGTLVLLGCIVLLLWKKRDLSFLQLGMIRWEGRRTNLPPTLRQVNRQLHKLTRMFGDKLPHQTVREYVKGLQASNAAQREALLEFTRIYEDIHYDEGKRHTYTNREIVQAWKAIQSTQKTNQTIS
ncbi:Protein-glutamine gamma-glutamyltransferase [compost metagenome]